LVRFNFQPFHLKRQMWTSGAYASGSVTTVYNLVRPKDSAALWLRRYSFIHSFIHSEALMRRHLTRLSGAVQHYHDTTIEYGI